MTPNMLYYGDNLKVLQQHIADASIDLIYLDPPFNSNRDYNVLFSEPDSRKKSISQTTAFEDTWEWTPETELLFDALAQSPLAPKRLIEMLNGFVEFLGRNDLTAYIVMLAARLIELHRVLKPQGSLFLHCDPTASHYIKITLDCIFGRDKMVSEISWRRSGTKSHATRRVPNSRDIIFWYSKSDRWTYNTQYGRYSEKYLKSSYRYIEEETGRRYRLDNVVNPNKNRPNLEYEWKGVKRVWRWTREKMAEMDKSGRLIYSKNGVPAYKRYLDEMPGVVLTNDWDDIPPLQGQSKEFMGYPTQKPRKLLERIIKMASNPGDVVLDPFCGCGTAIEAAEALERQWVGIDKGYIPIEMTTKRLENMFIKFRSISLQYEAV